MNHAFRKATASTWEMYPKKIVLYWLSLSFTLACLGFIAGSNTLIPGPSNLKTLQKNPLEKISYTLNIPPKDFLTVVLSHPTLTSDNPTFKSALSSLVSLLLNVKGPQSQQNIFEKVDTLGRTFFDDSQFLSKDQKHVLLVAETTHSIDISGERLEKIPDIIQKWQEKYTGFEAHYLSDGTTNNEMFDLINRDLDSSLFITIPVTFLVLIWAFRSIGAACVPLLIAGMSLISSLGISSLLSHILGPISATASQLVVLLVLAVGIDYSLFIISRIREELQQDNSFVASIRKAKQTTGHAVLWSGVIVALSLCGLFLMEDTVLASMALVSVVAVLYTVASAVFVLPALLLLLGQRKLFAFSIFGNESRASASEHWWLKVSVQHPKVVLFFSVLLLLSLGSLVKDISLGSTVEPHTLPKSLQSHQAYNILRENFPNLAGSDFTILLQSPKLDELEDEGQLQGFFDALLAHETVHGPLAIDRSEDRSLVRFHFIATGSANAEESQVIVHAINSKLLPALEQQYGVRGAISGTLPYVVGDIDRYVLRTPIVFAAVLAVSILFLLLVFRSLVVAAKAMILNILSTLAAFGVLVLFFQTDIVAAWHFSVIESFLPPLLFSILFGLSMDYHVLLLSRVWEECQKGHSIHAAVTSAIARTFRTITGAAFIMVSVFSIIATLELPIMKELGVGLAVAIFIDATIIRCFLLPASMVLLGKYNWYLPRSLEFLPRIRLD